MFWPSVMMIVAGGRDRTNNDFYIDLNQKCINELHVYSHK